MAIASFNSATFATIADLVAFVQTDANVHTVIEILQDQGGTGNWFLFYK